MYIYLYLYIYIRVYMCMYIYTRLYIYLIAIVCSGCAIQVEALLEIVRHLFNSPTLQRNKRSLAARKQGLWCSLKGRGEARHHIQPCCYCCLKGLEGVSCVQTTQAATHFTRLIFSTRQFFLLLVLRVSRTPRPCGRAFASLLPPCTSIIIIHAALKSFLVRLTFEVLLDRLGAVDYFHLANSAIRTWSAICLNARRLVHHVPRVSRMPSPRMTRGWCL